MWKWRCPDCLTEVELSRLHIGREIACARCGFSAVFQAPTESPQASHRRSLGAVDTSHSAQANITETRLFHAFTKLSHHHRWPA